ncbi:methylated-DNA--[protein]-cysteine S-methyltransferase [Malacoplasma penetrans]|uniref:Methylated-DNA--protein-cysteine methyltransferase n=1 Tax=Malacoplasma penetrans (strain HF-2) TaxID=272633 RepID=Q8EWL8_MALP2|nr:methylated-DNA--[protein]-cysteine S-methyltransferase [Malacoplasma penetrans]RXY96345.1 methylated-DNA--[protein]-cysteine S-methyltransferase [Malacoplasma penetrans]BAC43976.1 6-O-methylguanine DNA methyltransferas [Malacoplasma penetrans HF-2]
MIYTSIYKSPLGEISIACSDNKLIGLWIEGQKHFFSKYKNDIVVNNDIEILIKTKKWLDKYFKGLNPNPKDLEINPQGSAFQIEVWNILSKIPYGKTITYNDIAKEIANSKGIKKMSAQAVGGAVGHNPLTIIIPCHRVVGCKGNLTGYAGGLDKKIYLLELEKCNMDDFFLPKIK